MVAELLSGQPELQEFAKLLRHEVLPDGTDPEERIVFCGLSWERSAAAVVRRKGGIKNAPPFPLKSND